MRLILFLLVLSTLFSNCNSNSSIDTAGKKDSATIGEAGTVPSKHSKAHNLRSENHHEGTVSENGSYSPSANQQETSAPQSETPHKKGWSAAAKDAVIGGAAGAAAGAIIDKNNRLVGGVVGAAIGSGAGYLIGRSRDRKTGRVVKHRSAY
jgi:hypothetical protein